MAEPDYQTLMPGYKRDILRRFRCLEPDISLKDTDLTIDGRWLELNLERFGDLQQNKLSFAAETISGFHRKVVFIEVDYKKSIKFFMKDH